MPPTCTIGQALRDCARRLAAAACQAPETEAALLLSHIMRIDRPRLLLSRESAVGPEALAALGAFASRRARREPLQYVVGYTEFYSIPILTAQGVLVPRPETETVVEAAASRLRAGFRVLDAGTGSGCIAIALCRQRADVRAVALDLSRAALRLCRRNAAAAGVAGRVVPVCADMGSPVLGRPFDLVVSNPPYVKTGELPHLPPEVRNWEPALALDGGLSGLAAYGPLVEMSRKALRKGGWLVLELPGTGDSAVARLVDECTAFGPAEVTEDLSGKPRALAVQRLV